MNEKSAGARAHVSKNVIIILGKQCRNGVAPAAGRGYANILGLSGWDEGSTHKKNLCRTDATWHFCSPHTFSAAHFFVGV